MEMSNDGGALDRTSGDSNAFPSPPATPTQPLPPTQHSIPMCLSCGSITPWQVGPLFQPIHLIIGLVFLIAWGGGLVYLIVVGMRRGNPNNREKICPLCRAKNMWTFVYSDDAAARTLTFSSLAQEAISYSSATIGSLPGVIDQSYSQSVNGSTILTLGIASFFCVPFLLGPIAWYMGSQALKAIDDGQANPAERRNVAAGRICGMIATGVGILIVFAWLSLHASR